MGKRSRKRSLETGPGDGAGSGSTRAERDAARRERARQAKASPQSRGPAPRPGRTSIEDRPKPLWHPFPLTELVTLGGIGLMLWGFLSPGGSQGNKRVAAGLAIASLAGLELSVREHVTGFRSHTTLLAGAVGILTVVVLGLVAGVQVLGVLLLSGLAAFAASFYGLRELFRRRSGGLSFR
jgi:hypothetical protein